MNKEFLYGHYSRGNPSEKITVFKEGGLYLYIHEAFKRTNPNQQQRAQGIKPKRILTRRHYYILSSMITKDGEPYPFSHLL